MQEYGIKPIVVDEYANKNEVKSQYDIDLDKIENIKNIDCLVMAVAHDKYKNMDIKEIEKLFKSCENQENIIIDVKSIFNKKQFEDLGYKYWNL